MTAVLFDGRRRHVAGEGTRLTLPGRPGRRHDDGTVTDPTPERPAGAPRALCGQHWWPLTQWANDLVDHGFDEDQVGRMFIVWSRRPLCETCQRLEEAAA